MTEWTTVARADGVAEADLVRMRLEAGGVSVVVRDTHMIRMTPILSNILGGVRIDVPVAQERRGREILDQVATRDGGGVPAAESRKCPACGSSDLVHASRNRAGRLVAACLALLLGAAGVPRGLNRELRCRACGAFTPEETGPRVAQQGGEGDGAG